MKSTKKRLVLVLAIVGLCALLYGGWRIFEGQVAENEKRNFFAAPASSASGAPDAFHNAAPPPQP
jgi:hypothetical protein